MFQDELLSTIEQVMADLEELKNRVEKLEKADASPQSLPETALLSPSFVTRAFAVWGLNLVAGLMIGIPFYLILGVLALASR